MALKWDKKRDNRESKVGGGGKDVWKSANDDDNDGRENNQED